MKPRACISTLFFVGLYLSAPAPISAQTVPSTLKIGEVFSTTVAGRVDLTMDFTDRDYELILYALKTTTDPTKTFSFTVFPPAAAKVAFVRTLTAPEPDDQDRVDMALRAEERRLAEILRRNPFVAPKPMLTQAPSIGSERKFALLKFGGVQQDTSVTAKLVAVSNKALAYVDVNMTGLERTPITTAQIQAVLDEFDRSIYPLDTSVFGAESDVDGDGRLLFLFTPLVNRVGGNTVGFYSSASVMPKNRGGNGNLSDMMYLSPDRELTSYRSLLAHEFQHLINFNQHVLVRSGGDSEESWLNEALSHVAEDMVGDHTVDNANRVKVFLAHPEQFPLTGDANFNTGIRGAAYLFLRGLVDQKGQGVLSSLTQTSKVGVTNVEAVTGQPFADLYRQWAARLFLSGTKLNADPAFNYTFSYLTETTSGRRVIPAPREDAVTSGSASLSGALQQTGVTFIRLIGSGLSAKMQVSADLDGDVRAVVIPVPKAFRPQLVAPVDFFQYLKLDVPISSIQTAGTGFTISGSVSDPTVSKVMFLFAKTGGPDSLKFVADVVNGRFSSSIFFTPSQIGTYVLTPYLLRGGPLFWSINSFGPIVVIGGPVAAPSGLTATPRNNQVSLTWTANTEPDLSYYIVYRSGMASALGDSIGKIDKLGTSFINTGLAAGTYYYRIKAVNIGGNKSSESNQASATLAPVIFLSSNSLSFGSVNVGTSSTQTFTVSNTGTAALTVSGITISGIDAVQFTVSPTSFTVNAGAAAQTVTVTFTPVSEGSKSASLSISHNAVGGPSAVALSGIGVVIPVISAVPGVITTIAGNGISGFSGDGGPATQASLSPRGVAVDTKGVVYIADFENNRVRRIGLDGTITTFAGWGPTGLFSGGYSGDGGLAVQARLKAPTGVAVDGKGNLYIADWGNSRIRRVGTDGIITTIAGNGTAGFSGDGGPATQASLSPMGVAVDARGNVYIANAAYNYIDDAPYNRISRVGSDGIITTIAGNGTAGFSGDGGPATQASLSHPHSLAVDAAGIVYIADTGNNRIRRVGLDGIITTFVGTGVGTGNPAGRGGFSGDGGPAILASLNLPNGVAVDASGNVYIADTGNNRIRRVGPDGIIMPFAGTGALGFSGDGGPAILASLNLPNGVAVDASGNVYIAGDRVHRVEGRAAGGIVPPPGVSSPLVRLSALSLVFDSTKVGEISQMMFTVSNVGGGNLSITKISVDGWDASQFKVSPVTATIASGGQPQTITVTFAPTSVGPKSVALSIFHNAPGNPSAVVLNGMGLGEPQIITTIAGVGLAGLLGEGGPAVQAVVGDAVKIALDANGNIYIASGIRRLRRVGPDGIITTIAGTGTDGFSGDGGPAIQAQLGQMKGVAVDVQGNVYIADYGNHRIRRVGPDGIITTIAGTSVGFSGDGGPAIQAQLNSPQGVAVDAQGNVYIADSGNHRIRRVGPDGIITTIAGTGFVGRWDGGSALQTPLWQPTDVAVDARGNVYIADSGNHRIRRVGPDGIITTIAGTGGLGFSGDGGPAIQAQLNYPEGVTVDSKGNVYIADTSNHRIRQVWPNGIITTIAGTGTMGLFGIGGFSGDGGPAIQAQLNFPRGAAVDAQGNIYIADHGNGRIRRINVSGPTGPPPGINKPSITLSVSSLAFGSVRTTTGKTLAFTVGNSGNAPLSVSSISVTGTDAGMFSVTPASLTVNPGEAPKTVTMTFSPPAGSQSSTSKSAFVSLVHNASGISSSVSLTGIATAPTIVVSPSPLAFGSVKVGQTRSLNLTISNTGTDTLFINNVGIFGANASQFSLVTTQYTILPNGNQFISVPFTPTTTGDKAATLTLTHNSAPTATSTTVSLTGTGSTLPPPTLNPVTLAFGNVKVGQSKSLTLTVNNSDSSAAVSVTGITSSDPAFTISPTTLNLPARGSQTITVTFAPTNRDLKSAALTLTYTTGTGPATVTGTMTGQGTQPVISLSPADTLRFGEGQTGQSVPLTLRISNTGNDTLFVIGITVSGPDAAQFTVSPTTLTILPAQSGTVTVTFVPTSAGAKSVMLSIVHNAAGSPSTVSLTGTGTQQQSQTPVLSVLPPSINFGGVKVGDTKTETVTVTNAGGGSLNIGRGFLGSEDTGDFEGPVLQDVILTAGQSTKIVITFHPKSTGVKPGKFLFTHNVSGVDNPFIILLSGTGAQPPSAAISLSPTSLLFADVPVGQNKAILLTVGNTGNAALIVSGITVSGKDAGQFTVSPTSFMVNVGATAQTVTVTFIPSSTGAKSASLSITHNAANSPSTVSLNGNGIATPDLVAQSISGPTTAAPGQSITVKRVIANNSNVNSGAFTVHYYLSTDKTITITENFRIGEETVDSGLEAGGKSTRDITLTIPDNVIPRRYYLGMIVDIFNAVPESDKKNNVILTTQIIEIKFKPSIYTLTRARPSQDGSVGMAGGTIFQYYKLNDDRNQAVNQSAFRLELTTEEGRSYIPSVELVRPGLYRVGVHLDSIGLSVGGRTNLRIQRGMLNGKEVAFVEPPIFSAGKKPRMFEHNWDVFAAGSAGANFIAGGAGAGPSVAAARLSIRGEGGVGITVIRDQDGIFTLSRRLEGSLGVKVAVPAAQAVVARPQVGIGSQVTAIGMISQTVKFDNVTSNEAKLAQAGFLLETFSLGGISMGPTAGLVIGAIVQTINKLGGASQVLGRAEFERTVGGGIEGAFISGFGVKAGPFDLKFLDTSLSASLRFGETERLREGGRETFLDAATNTEVAPLQADFTLFKTDGGAFGSDIGVPLKTADFTGQKMAFDATGHPSSYSVGFGYDIDGGISLNNSTRRVISEVTIQQDVLNELLNRDAEQRNYRAMARRLPLILGPNSIVADAKNTLTDALKAAERLNTKAFDYTISVETGKARELSFDVEFDIVAGVGIGGALGVRGSYYDATMFVAEEGMYLSDHVPFPLARYRRDQYINDATSFIDVSKELLSGVKPLIGNALKELLNVVTSTVKKGVETVTKAIDKAGEAIAQLFVDTKASEQLDGAEVQISTYSPETPRAGKDRAGKPVVRMKYESTRVQHKRLLRSGKLALQQVETVLTIISQATVVNVKGKDGKSVLTFDPPLMFSMKVKEEDLLRNGFSTDLLFGKKSDRGLIRGQFRCRLSETVT